MLTTQAYCESINHKSLASTMGQTCDYKEGQSLSSLISLTPGDGGFLRDTRGQTSLAVLTGSLVLALCLCLSSFCSRGRVPLCVCVPMCLQARVLRGRGGSEAHVLVILRE